MFGDNRIEIRRVFSDAWARERQKQPLDPLQQIIVGVIHQHQEYLPVLEAGEESLDRDYPPEAGVSNPFLHMGMHISIQEQIGADRPAGIRSLYQQLTAAIGDAHEAEHQIMECLGRMLWEAQRAGGMPDEKSYLNCVKSLLR